MKITREKLVNLSSVLGTLSNEKMKAKAAYGIMKNKRIVDAEVEIIREAQQKLQPPEEFLEFEKQRVEVCKDFANKDEEGEPKTFQGVGGTKFDIPDEKIESFEAKVSELKEEFKDAVDKQSTAEEEWMELMQENIELDVHGITIDQMPDTITPAQLDILDEIVSEG